MSWSLILKINVGRLNAQEKERKQKITTTKKNIKRDFTRPGIKIFN